MGALSQVMLALVAWFAAIAAPMGKLHFEDRGLPVGRQRGVSVLPGWPLMPLLFLAPMPFLGARHLVLRLIAAFHAVLLVWALSYIAYWTIWARRDG